MVTFIVFILVFSLCGGIFITLNRSENLNVDEIISGFEVFYEKRELSEDEKLYIDGEAQFEIKQRFNRNEDVHVTIMAVESSVADFSFKVDGLTYYWNHVMVNKDVSKYLLQEICQPTESGANAVIKISGTVPELLTSYFRSLNGFSKTSNVEVSSVPECELFKMDVEVGEKKKSFLFFIGCNVDGLALNTTKIVF